eukprot:XP_001704874.1 Hypothetical protein GL50803_88413 [Giardia lamblia ATCC 50803]
MTKIAYAMNLGMARSSPDTFLSSRGAGVRPTIKGVLPVCLYLGVRVRTHGCRRTAPMRWCRGRGPALVCLPARPVLLLMDHSAPLVQC